MEDLSLKEILTATGFRFNKGLGQNFIADKNLLKAIAADSGLGKDEVALEVGTGAGTLTKELALAARKVLSFEVDKALVPVLELSLRGVDNVEVIFKDVLKMRDDEIMSEVGEPFRVVANLPYYITTPLIMRFLESDLPVKSLTVMVQKEVADRLVASVGSADYAAITLAVQMAGKARITRAVSRNMFYPAPNVDSAVVHIDVDKDALAGEDKSLLRKLVKSAFAMRRKTLANNLAVAFGMDKASAAGIIERAGFAPMIRGEALSLSDFIALSHELKKA